MPYAQTVSRLGSLSRTEAQQLTNEFNLLRAELDDMRAKYAATVALLAAGTAVGAGYNTGTALAAKRFNPT